jgi:predicted DCC family thiol-disulfide oxidoreductase YuxK
VSFDVPADQDRYSKSRIMDESERIRSHIQDAVYEMLRDRRSIWFG